ncbi:MAG: hypothetical protein ACUVRS_03520 [Armatimonadota bacterium]
MEIERVEHHSVEELIESMRRVGMLTDPDIKIYQNSQIEVVTLHTDEITPAQRYVLVQEILKVRELRWTLLDWEVDIFKLDGYVTLWLQGLDEPIDLLPPVVERSMEADGSVVKILNDGMHRAYLARMERSPIQVVYIRDVPREYPYYAYPLVNGWNEVQIVNELAPEYIKKWHRIPNYKTLYRDFNTAFRNVGGPRGRFVNAAK